MQLVGSGEDTRPRLRYSKRRKSLGKKLGQGPVSTSDKMGYRETLWLQYLLDGNVTIWE